MPLLLNNIKKLLTMKADEHSSLGIIEDAAVIIDEKRIVWVGAEKNLPFVVNNKYDCLGGVVLPGFIDCHTHLVFAGSRADEFALRSEGATYHEIMLAGGGILSTMVATRQASKKQLIDLALPRLYKMLQYGVTLLEAKTGYGLNIDTELKTLEVMSMLGGMQSVEICPTFLAAHAIPPEFENQTDFYVKHIIEDMLPMVKAQNIARFCDVFVEKGAFSSLQGLQILEAAQEYGLASKVHAEQLSHFGGTRLAAKVGAVSAAHLEFADDSDLKLLHEKNIVAEILPIAQEYLGLKHMIAAKKFQQARVAVAISTDFNPGSSMCDNLQLAARLSVTRCGFTCAEALLGITRNAALALGREDVGSVAVDKMADLCVLSTANPWDLLYDWTTNPVRSVFKNGQLVHETNNGCLASSPVK